MESTRIQDRHFFSKQRIGVSHCPRVDAYCAVGASESQAQIALQGGPFSHVWRSWGDVQAFTLHAVTLIAIMPNMTENEFRQFSGYRARFPNRPLVAVVGEDANTARLIGGLSHVEVVWTAEVSIRLRAIVFRLEQATVFGRLADSVSVADDVPPALRRALKSAVIRRRPIRSVAELASDVQRSPSTLERAWNDRARAQEKMRLKDFLDWLLLLRAAQRKEYEGSWNEAAAAVGIDPRTLSRLSLRLTGRRLNQLDVVGFAWLSARCLDAINSTLSPRSNDPA